MTAIGIMVCGISFERVSSNGRMLRCIGCNGVPLGAIQSLTLRTNRMQDTPKCWPNSRPFSISQDQAHTVKNLSSCSSNACCPSVDRIDVNEPCVSCDGKIQLQSRKPDAGIAL